MDVNPTGVDVGLEPDSGAASCYIDALRIITRGLCLHLTHDEQQARQYADEIKCCSFHRIPFLDFLSHSKDAGIVWITGNDLRRKDLMH